MKIVSMVVKASGRGQRFHMRQALDKLRKAATSLSAKSSPKAILEDMGIKADDGDLTPEEALAQLKALPADAIKKAMLGNGNNRWLFPSGWSHAFGRIAVPYPGMLAAILVTTKWNESVTDITNTYYSRSRILPARLMLSSLRAVCRCLPDRTLHEGSGPPRSPSEDGGERHGARLGTRTVGEEEPRRVHVYVLAQAPGR